MAENSAEEIKNGKIGGIVLDVESYSKEGLKKVILKIMESNEEKNPNFGKWLGQKITKGLIESMPSSTPEGLLDMITSWEGLNELVCDKISGAVNKTLKGKGIEQQIKIIRLDYKKIGDNGLKVALKLDNFDIDSLMSSILKVAETETHSTGLEVVKAIHKSVDGDSKLLLVNTILAWINANGVINTVLRVLEENEKEPADVLKLLNLDVKEIGIIDI